MENIIFFLQKNQLAITAICLTGFLFFAVKSFSGIGSDIKRASKTKLYLQKLGIILNRAYTRILKVFSGIPVIGDIVKDIAYSYKCHEALTDDEAALRTGQVIFFTIMAFIAAFTFGMFWFNDVIIPMMTSVTLAHVAMTALRSKPQKFLDGLRNAVEDFLLTYHKSSGNIDDAFHAVIKSRNSVARHFSTMYTYIKRAYVSPAPDLVQNEYNAIAPSRFLRNIYAIIYMTYKFGDQMEEGRSALNINLMEVQEQIGDALYQQNKLLDESSGERWFIIAPVFAIPMLSKYMEEYFAFEGFEFITTFIHSSLGYMVSVICAGTALVCYLIYARMAERGILEQKSNSDWARKALRYPWIRRVTSKLLPPKSAWRKSMATTIKKAGRTESVDAMQVKQVFVALVLVVVAVLSAGVNYWQNNTNLKNDIYTGLAKPNYEKLLLTQNDNKKYEADMLDADWKIVKYIPKIAGYRTMSEAERFTVIRNYMRTTGLVTKYRGYESYGITRIMAKYERRQNVSGLNMAVFIAMMGLLGYVMPYALVFVQAQMNKDLLLLDETSDLQKTAIMLMEYPQTTPNSLLTWYASSTVLLAPQLRECAVTHDFDALVASTNYKPFIQVATCLQMAFGGLTLKDAFSGVEQRLLTQKKEQNRVVEKMLHYRVDTIGKLTSIAMYSVLGLYVFVPLVVAMLQMFTSMNVFHI